MPAHAAFPAHAARHHYRAEIALYTRRLGRFADGMTDRTGVEPEKPGAEVAVSSHGGGGERRTADGNFMLNLIAGRRDQ